MSRRSWTRGPVIASAVVGGLMGSLVDRSLIATPAWEQLGVQAWADYSRHADLGNGLIVYPIAFIGWTVLAVAAAVSFRFDRAAPRTAAVPVYLAALFMLIVMATTVKAAPIMLGVAHLGEDTSALRRAFEDFTFWGVYVRGAALTLAFLAAIWAASYLPAPR
ncbi:MAG: hypothetical protein M3Y48_11115 [Actinomycetota bacterium]|nr:hypothetical protein [Actinomycetota bacterium]